MKVENQGGILIKFDYDYFYTDISNNEKYESGWTSENQIIYGTDIYDKYKWKINYITGSTTFKYY